MPELSRIGKGEPLSQKRSNRPMLQMNRLRLKLSLGLQLTGIVFALALASPSQSDFSSAPLRPVQGQTIFSKKLPAAELTFGKDFRYVDGQAVNLYGNAEAEQQLFVKAAGSGPVERFYWVQFEHFLPTNTRTYDYQPLRTIDIGGLQFIYDVKSWLDYAAMQAEDPASDGAAIARILAQQNLSFPKRTVRVRMFYLPTPDRRSELMIIYGEALPVDSKIPVRKEGVQLDTDSPEAAKLFLNMRRQTYASAVNSDTVEWIPTCKAL
jgi:hypothetical protein